MTSCELIRSMFTPAGAPGVGMNFNRCRRDDLWFVGPGLPPGYQPKRWVEGEIEYYDDLWGNIWQRMKDGCVKGEIARPALEDWSGLDDLRFPVYDRAKTAEIFRAGFAEHPDKFKAAVMPDWNWIFAAARYLRKMENYLLDLALYPDELHKLHQRLAAVFEPVILAAVDAGADAISFGEDLGTQKGLLFSPAMWDEYFRDIYTRLFGIMRDNGRAVLMHSCGQNRQLVEPLLKAGVSCFQFDQPRVYDFADLGEVLTRYQAALWSPVDIQQIMPTGDRVKIQAEAEAMCQAFAGRLIAKNYPDLAGIGVREEWDDWAYEVFERHALKA